jgi:hypothetical protein
VSWKIFGILAAVGLILGFYVWQQTQSVRLGYRVEEMKRECEKWDQDNANLNLKLRKLMSLERLDQFARDKKLVVPGDKNRIYLK